MPSSGGRLLVSLVVAALLVVGSLAARNWFGGAPERQRASGRAPASAAPPEAPSPGPGAAATEPPRLPVSVVEVPTAAHEEPATKPAPPPPVPSVETPRGEGATRKPQHPHPSSSPRGNRPTPRSNRAPDAPPSQAQPAEPKAGPVLPNPYTR
jgi:hypothetical protein